MSEFGRQPDGSVRYRPVEDAVIPRDRWREQRDEHGRYASARCGACNGSLALRVHSVNRAGKVSPSIGCVWCGWHVWGTLADFDLEPIKRS